MTKIEAIQQAIDNRSAPEVILGLIADPEKDVYKAVLKVTGLTRENLVSKTQTRYYADGRKLFWLALTGIYKYTAETAGPLLNKDRTTALFANSKAVDLIHTNKDFRQSWYEICELLGADPVETLKHVPTINIYGKITR